MRSNPRTFDQYRGTNYFPELDGLRAVSVVLVLLGHSQVPLWDGLHGYLGVTIFFCLSGFLITTLLLREHDKNGRVDLRAFWLRRAFRILPLYYLVLVVSTVLVVVGLGSGSDDFGSRLPLLASLNGEFAGSGTFSHSWSVGIEEKFYLAWPLVLVLLLPRHGAPGGSRFSRTSVLLVLGILGGASLLSAFFPPVAYFSVFISIFAGAAVAVLLANERWYAPIVRSTSALRWPVWATVALVAVLDGRGPTASTNGYAHPIFGLAVAPALVLLVTGGGTSTRALSARPVAWLGTLAYSVYLIHPLVLAALNRVVRSDDAVAIGLVRTAALLVGSVLMGAVLHWAVEAPLIRRGRSLSRRLRPTVQ